ncbi:hypothetical protein [Campylobacter ureolyticus]|uniref:hypothetical protein n=1 Tax=Campylobacter ureolyticus TaxID=827 RepID=UPI0028896C20|nr:hypothetical protein [Campylobacter ureolyticus]
MFIKEGFIKEGFIRSNPSNLTNCGGNAFVKGGFVKDGFIKSDGSCSSDKFIIKTITIPTNNTQNQSEQKILSFLEQKETNNIKLIANLITPNAVWVIPSAFLQSKGLKTYENKSFDEEKLNQKIKEIENSLNNNIDNKIKDVETRLNSRLQHQLPYEVSNQLSSVKLEYSNQIKESLDTWTAKATESLDNKFNEFRKTKLDLTDNELNILANKIIEILEINGKEINYSPTMASVKVFKDGIPINIPLERNSDGSLKGDMSILGDDKIYIEIK